MRPHPGQPATDPNSYDALHRRLHLGTLTWRGPARMLFGRTVFAVGAQALVAAVFALRSSPTPWHAAEPWLPVYGTLIDAGCLALLWRLTRREGIRLVDLVGFERARLGRDTLLGFALIPVYLAFILGGIAATGWLLYGTLTPPYLSGPLPLPAALYGVLVWPFIWGLTEQMTYNGYLVPRFQVLCRSTSVPIAGVAFAWVAPACVHAVDLRCEVHGLSAVIAGACLGLRNARLSETSPAGSLRHCARPDGWSERADRRAASAVDGMNRLSL